MTPPVIHGNDVRPVNGCEKNNARHRHAHQCLATGDTVSSSKHETDVEAVKDYVGLVAQLSGTVL